MRKNLIGLLFIGVLLSACGSSSKDSKGELNDKKAELEKLKGEQSKLNEKIAKLEEDIAKLDTNAAAVAKLVAIAPVQAFPFEHYIEIQGTVEATNISYVAPPNGQGGVVRALYVRQGQNVSRGQVLARLDDAVIRQQIEIYQVQLNAANDTYKRMKNLYDQGIGTYQSVLNAKTQAEQLQATINTYKKQAAQMVVTAPQSGVADVVNIRVGEILSPQQNPQQPQIRIVNTGDLKIKANIPENYQSKVAVGSPLEVILPDENNRVVNATVTVVSKIIDPAARTFYIEAKVPSSSNLKPNQVAKVHIKDYGNQNAITIPMSTLQNDETGKYVMVAVKEKDKLIARKRTVTVGELYNDKLEVKSGLQAGDQLITEGFQNLYDGQLITTQVK